MTNYGKRACALAITVLGFFAVTAHAQQCATPAATDFYVDKDNASASDSANGHYTTSGGTGPFATIQHLIDTLQPGQCGWVKPSATPYYENTWRAGDYSGITFTHGGTSDTQRIFVAGYPGGAQPIVDQQRAAPTHGYALAGFFLYQGSYITIQNFEVRNAGASGILLNPTPNTPPAYVNITGNHVHNMPGTGNPNNVGGIRIDYCHYCNITNNVVNNIGDDQGADGINAFQPGGCIIANNLVYNAAIGIQLKQADNSGAHLAAHDVHGNIFANLSVATYKMQIQGAANLAAPHNPTFHDNIVYNVAQGIWADLSQAGEQATNLTVYNNTFINTGRLAALSNFSGVQIYNNIYVGSAATSFAAPFFIFNTYTPTPWVNQISYFDNNLYNNLTQTWQIETYNNPTTYSSLAAWRAANREVVTPDLKAQFADPKFTSSALAITNLLLGTVTDYALQAGSPGLTMGRNGDEVGAVRPGVSIGPSGTAVLTSGSGTTPPPPTPVPNPPSDVTVQ